ncbi:MAG: peptidoglycan-binding protein [Actinomycetia bacterium]|nr:peptidoglycan-binding protein [Actinomycetes bacterium]
MGQIDVVALITDHPFFRPITLGSMGDDVESLQCALRDEGFYSGECNGTVGSATSAAIRDFNDAIGRGRVRDFDPSFVVWLPADQVDGIVATVNVAAGGWPPGQGQPIVEYEAAIEQGSLDVSESAARRVAGFDPLIFELASDQSLTVAIDGNEVSTEDTSRIVRAASVEASAGLETSTIRIEGFVTSPSTREVIGVPTVAIVEGVDGACVFVEDGPGGFVAEMITPLDSTLAGSTFVSEQLAEGMAVLLNPLQLGFNKC